MPPTRNNAEDFDPEPAYIFSITRESRTSGVPGVATATQLFETRIKPPRGMFASELTNNQIPDSRSDVIIEIWNDGPDSQPQLGANLTADMYIMHRGFRYDIVGRNDVQADYRRETTRYQCRVSNNP